MRVLVIGAGVIGSFNAVRLWQGGHEVELLARGARLEQLRRHGVVIEGFRGGRREEVFLPLIERVDPDRSYDLVLVVVRRNQVGSVLPPLSGHAGSSCCLFLGNNAAGSADLTAALGVDRVMIGMANAGGAFDGHVVRYVWSRWTPLLFGEIDDVRRPRDDAVVAAFAAAGLPARWVRNIDARQKTHAAGLPSFAGALYRAGGDVRALSHDRRLVGRWLAAFGEAQLALRADGTRLQPAASWAVNRVPACVLVPLVARFLDTRLAVVGGQAHAMAAADEMKELADEWRDLFARTGVPHPASEDLFAEVDARAALASG